MDFDKLKDGTFGQGEIGSQGPGFVYDPQGIDPYGSETPCFPDVGKLLDDVNSILECMCTSEMMELKKKDKNEFQTKMEQQFPDFSFRYYTLFLKLLSGEDITPLMSMLATIEKIKSGSLSMEEAEQGIGESLARKYVLPKLNKSNKNPKQYNKK